MTTTAIRATVAEEDEEMRKEIAFAAGFALCLAAIVGDRALQAEPSRTNTQDSLMLTRACSYAAGGMTEVDCSAGFAYSAQLNANSRYVVQAQGGSAYVRQGTAGSGQDAAAGSAFLLPSTGAIDIYTRDGRYFSCDGTGGVATGGKVYYGECK